VSRSTTRPITFKKPRTQSSFEKEEKEKLQEDHGFIQERRGLLQEGQSLLHARQRKLEEHKKELQKEATTSKIVGKYLQEIQEPSPQPSLGSYYKFIEGGRIIPEKFEIPLLYEMDIERGGTHRWMKIAKSKNVEDVGLMEEKVTKTGKELSDFRMRESIMKEKLQAKNTRLRERL